MILKNVNWAKALRKIVKNRDNNGGLFGFAVNPERSTGNPNAKQIRNKETIKKHFSWSRYNY